jgi:peptidoglycan/xylan/chitin deacetylase (PgdA/CDA1 family)
MTVRRFLGKARRQVLSGVARREVRLSAVRPLISFTFDDFPKSALSTGGAILKDFGLRGTYYAAAGLMGTTTEVGPIFDERDLPSLLDAGHELACHTYSHISARNVELPAYHEDVLKGERALAQYLGGSARLNFSYPFGGVTIRVKRKVAPAMRSCRGIFPGLDGPIVDLNLLHGNNLYGRAESLPAIQSAIGENTRQRRWLIFYVHDVQPVPSDYGCTPEFFEKVVRCAVESGSEIVTVAKALDYAT